MQTNYCGAVWTIVAILAGAGLDSGYRSLFGIRPRESGHQYVLRNDDGEEVVASAEELGLF